MPRLMLRSLPGTLADRGLPDRRGPADRVRPAGGRALGRSPSRASPRSTSTATTSTRPSASRAWGSSRGWSRTGHRPLCHGPWPRCSRPARPWRTSAAWRRGGAEGPYGFYEAIDYTPERVPKGKRSVVVRSYMAHHQGMSLVALNNTLHADVDDPPLPGRADGAGHRAAAPGARCPATRRSSRPSRRTTRRAGLDGGGVGRPAVAECGHGRRADEPTADDRRSPPPRARTCSPTRQYHVMLTNAGSGVSTCRGPRHDPLARGRRARGLGPVRLRPRPRARARSGRPASSRSAGRPRPTRSSSPTTRPPSAAATWGSRPCSR